MGSRFSNNSRERPLPNCWTATRAAAFSRHLRAVFPLVPKARFSRAPTTQNIISPRSRDCPPAQIKFLFASLLAAVEREGALFESLKLLEKWLVQKYNTREFVLVYRQFGVGSASLPPLQTLINTLIRIFDRAHALFHSASIVTHREAPCLHCDPVWPIVWSWRGQLVKRVWSVLQCAQAFLGRKISRQAHFCTRYFWLKQHYAMCGPSFSSF